MDIEPSQTTPQDRRILAARGQAPRFARNAAISLPTFLLDLGLLALLVRHAHVGYLAATIISFLVANGLNYFLGWLRKKARSSC